MKISFSKQPIDSSTLQELTNEKIKPKICKKIRSYLYAYGHPTTEIAIEQLYADFVAHMADEKKIFRPELYLNDDFREYTIEPYILARVDAFMKSVGSELSSKLNNELSLTDDGLEDDGRSPYPYCVSSNVVGKDDDFDSFEVDYEVPSLIEQTAFIKQEYGIDPVAFIKAAMAIENKEGEVSDILLKEGLSTSDYNSIKTIISNTESIFAPETGIEVKIESIQDQIEFLAKLTGRPVDFIYSTHSECGSKDPLYDTISELMSDEGLLPTFDNIIENIRQIAYSKKKKRAMQDYLNLVFNTANYSYMTEEGQLSKLSINKLFKANLSQRDLVDYVIDTIKSTGKLKESYMLALYERLGLALECRISNSIKNVIKGLVPVLVGKSEYCIEDIENSVNNIIASNRKELETYNWA